MEQNGFSKPQIEKTIRKEGAFGRKPSLGWKCLVKLKMEDCVPFEMESDYLKDVTEITIGNSNWPTDKAIEMCLQTMFLKEESVFRIKLSPTYEINLSIILEDWTERDYIFEWTDELKLETSKTYKAEGVELFKSKRIEHAFHKFSKALKMLLLMDLDIRSSNDHPSEKETLISLYNNLANCQFHFKNYSHVIELCSKSLSVSPSAKGYFRRALAYIELENYENAENDLLALLKIEPKNKAAIEKFRLVRDLDKANRENYEAIIKNMFR